MNVTKNLNCFNDLVSRLFVGCVNDSFDKLTVQSGVQTV